MSERFSHAHRMILVVLLFLAWPAICSAQSDPCKNEGAQKSWDSGQDPVYADTMELVRTLTARGFVVDCVRSSLEQAMVKGQKGGAWFKTDQGIFNVWFLPKGQNFEALDITEQQQPNGRYSYSSNGAQQTPPMNSSKRNWFIKYENLLFHVWGDQQLATRLEAAFPKP